MSATKTLLQLRNEIRFRANMESSQLVTDPEMNTYINSSCYELYDLLTEAYGANYYVASPFSITTDGINNLFNLPATFYKLLGVDLFTGVNVNPYQAVKQFNFSERNRFQIPAAGRRVQLWHVPGMTPMVADTDIFDGINGWTEYVVIDCAIKCLVKEESDVTIHAAKLGQMKARIDQMSQNRNVGEPATITDVYNTDSVYLGPTLRYRLNGNQIWLGEYQLYGIYGGSGAY